MILLLSPAAHLLQPCVATKFSTLLTRNALQDDHNDRAKLCSTDVILFSVSLEPAGGQYCLSGMPQLLCILYLT